MKFQRRIKLPGICGSDDIAIFSTTHSGMQDYILYLGAKIDGTGGASADITIRINE